MPHSPPPNRRPSAKSPSSATTLTQPTPASAERIRLWLYVLLIVLGISLTYSNALDAAFVFDDFGYVDTPAGTSLWPPLWRHGTRPTMLLSLAINYALAEKNADGKPQPVGYHALNILIHIAVALSSFGLVRRTLQLPPAGEWPPSQANGIACAAALIWAVHPLTTQAVTYVIQRCEAMAALGIILYLYALLRSSQASTPRRTWAWNLAAVAACLFGLASKETGAMAIPIGLLFDRTMLACSWREVFARRGWIHLSLLVTATVGVALILPSLTDPTPGKTVGFNLGTFTWWEYARSQPGAILHYLRLAFWPAQLCVDYFWPASTNYQAVLPGMIIVAALGATIVLLWRRPAWGLMAGSFWLLMAPSSGTVAIQDIAFEHRFYAPLLLVVLSVAIIAWQGLQWLAARQNWTHRQSVVVASILCLMLVGALSWRTHRRNEDYRSEQALWEADVQVSPENPRLHSNLGLIYLKQDRYEEALWHYREALRTSRGGIARLAYDYEANGFMGMIYRDLGRPDEAITHLRAALSAAMSDQQKIAVGLELAPGLDATGRTQEAEAVFAQLLNLDADQAKLYWTYAEFLERHGRQDAALEHWQKAAALEPNDARLLREVRRRLGRNPSRKPSAGASASTPPAIR